LAGLLSMPYLSRPRPGKDSPAAGIPPGRPRPRDRTQPGQGRGRQTDRALWSTVKVPVPGTAGSR